jgi:hypothetical protein
LHDDLTAVSDVATPPAHEILLSHDAARVLDPDLGDEDCAAIAFVDHRALFDAAHPQAASAQTRSFATFASKNPRPLPDDPDGTHRATFIRMMSEELDARARSDHFRMHEHRSGVERHRELVYGRLSATRDLLGKTNGATTTHDVTAVTTDRTTERARAIFHDDTMRLDAAGPDWFEELVRRVHGVAYFGSASHFEGDETQEPDPRGSARITRGATFGRGHRGRRARTLSRFQRVCRSRGVRRDHAPSGGSRARARESHPEEHSEPPRTGVDTDAGALHGGKGARSSRRQRDDVREGGAPQGGGRAPAFEAEADQGGEGPEAGRTAKAIKVLEDDGGTVPTQPAATPEAPGPTPATPKTNVAPSATSSSLAN